MRGTNGENSADRENTGRIGDAISAQTRSEEAKDGSNQQSHIGSTLATRPLPQPFMLKAPAILVQFPLSGRTGTRG